MSPKIIGYRVELFDKEDDAINITLEEQKQVITGMVDNSFISIRNQIINVRAIKRITPIYEGLDFKVSSQFYEGGENE